MEGNSAVVGGFAGDEGKGKIVDLLAVDADWVARFEGGANAGHSIEVGDFKMIGHLLPSGAAAGKPCVLCRGVRVDPYQLMREVQEFRAKGGTLVKLLVDAGAFLSFPWHVLLEWWIERAKGSRMAYTTMRGMCGIAGSNAFRLNPQVGMLQHPDELARMLEDFYRAFQTIFEHPDAQAWAAEQQVRPGMTLHRLLDPKVMADLLVREGEVLLPHIGDARATLYRAWKRGEHILWEGAQGFILDPYWGTYQYNTQGICGYAGIPQGSGLPVDAIGRRVVVNKLVATRVGNGPFMTELGDYEDTKIEERIPDDQHAAWLADMLSKINSGHASPQEIGQYLRVRAKEYGATSGRPRRTGWFDAAMQQYFNAVNAPHDLVLTKLDCLSGLAELKICANYRTKGKSLLPGVVPALSMEYGDLRPVYITLPGWEEDITGETDFDKLPRNAQDYIQGIERCCGLNTRYIGTGPDRSHMIIR